MTEHDLPDLEARLEELAEPRFRARQILRALYRRAATSYDEMTDLPKELRARLALELPLLSTETAEIQRSADGTRKILVRLHDDRFVEAVMIPEGDRRTACISTQVGCPAGCVFCASGLAGLTRNLTAGEIVEQWIHLTRVVRDEGAEGLTNVVVMGMGEGLLNYDALVAGLRRLNHEATAGFGLRRVTVSTVGLPDRIDRLAAEGLPVHLALSLHGPDDATRSQIVPFNERWPVAEVVAAVRRYAATTHRDATFEYILLDGINDSPEHAARLAALAGRHVNVNLIPCNPVEGLPYRPPPRERVDAFAARLAQEGVVVNVRRTRGDDIDAACGQLRLKRS